jgi:hypothetical protein
MTSATTIGYSDSVNWAHTENISAYRMAFRVNAIDDDPWAEDCYNRFGKQFDDELFRYQLFLIQERNKNSQVRPYSSLALDNVAIENMLKWAAITCQMLFLDGTVNIYDGCYARLIDGTIKCNSPAYTEYFTYRLVGTGDTVFHMAISLWRYIAAKSNGEINFLDDIEKMKFNLMELGALHDDSMSILHAKNFFGVSVGSYLQVPTANS